MVRRLIVAALVVLAACANDGTTLRPPTDEQVRSANEQVEQPEAGFEAQATVDDFALSSTSFDDGDRLPVEHTCEGADVSPPLSWSGVPFGAAELAITVLDPEAGSFVHWAVAGLSPETTSIAEGSLPEGAVEARNDFGVIGWRGPCAPIERAYVFTLHVLPEPLGLAAELDGRQAVALIQGSTIRSVALNATSGEAG